MTAYFMPLSESTHYKYFSTEMTAYFMALSESMHYKYFFERLINERYFLYVYVRYGLYHG